MTPAEIKSFVLEDMARYLAEYETPPEGTTVGVPWSKARVAREIEEMQRCVVEPFIVDCHVEDTEEQRVAQIRRTCWVVAVDGSYGLLFDQIANDFALACRSPTDEWGTIGVRGDAVTTFLAR